MPPARRLQVRREVTRALGEAVRRRREKLGWTQEELGGKAKMHPTYIGGIERGERNITFVILFELAPGLGISPAELVADTYRILQRRRAAREHQRQRRC